MCQIKAEKKQKKIWQSFWLAVFPKFPNCSRLQLAATIFEFITRAKLCGQLLRRWRLKKRANNYVRVEAATLPLSVCVCRRVCVCVRV